MLRFIRQVLTALLSVSGSLATKDTSLNSEPFILRPKLII